MRSVLSAVLAALALAGPAAAQNYDGVAWTRTETPGGRLLWIAANDLASLTGAGSPADPVRVLIPRDPGGRVRYSISELTIDCRGETMNETGGPYGADGKLITDLDPAENRADEEERGPAFGELFAAACEGRRLLPDITIGTLREALEYDAMARARGWNPPPP